MKNEIKIRSIEQQAIDNLKAIINCEDKIIDIEPPLEDTAQILLDYITNLQEERNMFKGSFETMSKNYFEEKSRNEKAIEFLEHFDSGQQCEHTKDLAIIVENILQGEDKK